MNDVALFVYGSFVTLVVVAGIALLVWGAILDGRHNREVRERMEERERAGARVAAARD